MRSPADKWIEAERLNSEAVELQARGWYQQALDLFVRATQLFREVGDRKGEGRSMNGVGAVLKDLGEANKARDWLERALAIRRQVADRRGECVTLLTLGPVYQDLGEPSLAQESLARAVSLSRELDQSTLEGAGYFNLGAVYLASGKLREALMMFEHSLAIARETSNRAEENKCLNSLGLVFSALARFGEAIECFEQSLALCRELRNHLGESAVLENLAGLYRRLGQPDEALRRVQECLAILIQTNSTSLLPSAAALCGMILLYDHEDPIGAKGYLELAQDIVRKTEHRGKLANVLQHLGSVHWKTGQYERAETLLEESRKLYRQLGNTYGEAGALQVLSAMEAERGRYERAHAHCEKALRIAQETGDEWEAATGFFNLAMIHDATGQPERALELFETSVSIFDRLRYQIRGDALRTSFFDARTVQNAYYVCVSRLLRRYRETGDQTHAAKAFAASERRRARALLDSVACRSAPDGDLLAEPGSPGSAPNVSTHLGRLRTLGEIRRKLLDHRTLLLEYSLHQDSSYLFAVQKDGFEVYTLPGGNEIARQVYNVRRLLSGSRPGDFATASHELYRAILGPVAAELPAKKLLIVPDVYLQHLPFQALVIEPPAEQEGPRKDYGQFRFLLTQNSLTYVPSAAVACALQDRREGRKNVCANEFIGFAPFYRKSITHAGRKLKVLPQTKTEIQAIAKLFGSGQPVLKLGEVATKEVVGSGILRTYGYIHFATHGFADSSQGGSPGLLFHPGCDRSGLLHAPEIMDLQLNAELVVLSACQTALGRPSVGEGIIGLARAFLYAGAQAVCASLWEVSDAATSELMHRYYRNLITGGAESAEALRAAQQALLESDRYSAPYYWAPFILVGG